MTQMPDDAHILDVVKQSLLREAASQGAAGRSLVEGEWIEGSELAAAEQVVRRRVRRETAEALAFWGIVALTGIAFMGLTVLIL